MLPLNYLYCLHDRISLVPITRLADSYGLRPGQSKVLERYYSLRTIAQFAGSHNEMLEGVLRELVLRNVELQNMRGLLVYAKTQTHNTFFDDEWLSKLANRSGIGHWDSATLSLNHCATALSAIHFLKKRLIKHNQPLILITGEKAFHRDVSILENAVLAEIPTALLLNSGRSYWNIIDSEVVHWADFNNNHRDKTAVKRREIYSELENRYAGFYLYLLERFKIELSDVDMIVSGNIDLPLFKRVMKKINYRGSVFSDNISDYGHAYCSDIIFNLSGLLKEFEGKRILCVCMGMGITLSSILIERGE